MAADYTTRIVNYALETCGFYPLRPVQHWMIETHCHKANSTMMNISIFYKLDARMDLNRLAEVLNEITSTHDIFHARIVYHEGTGDLCQRFDGEVLPIKVEKISDEEFEERKKFLQKPYKLINNPLYRIELFETPTAKYVYGDFYHGMFDGATIAVLLLREVNILYEGKKNVRKPLRYADYVLDELRVSPEELKTGNKYWREILRGFDEKKHLPPSDIDSGETWQSNVIFYDIENIDHEFFSDKAWKEDIFFLAAAMLAIAKTSGAKSSIMSRVHNGRMNAQEWRIMGIMIEQIPVRWDFERDLRVEEFLDGLEQEITDSMKYRRSLGTVYSEGLEDNCATFIFQKKMRSDETFILGNFHLEVVEIPENKYSAAENTLDIEMGMTDDGKYFFELDYDSSRYSENAMIKFAKIMDEIILKLQDEKIFISEILK